MQSELDDHAQLFCHLKAYHQNGSFGSLCVPTRKFVQYVNSIEQIFVDTFAKVMTKNGLIKKLVESPYKI